MSNDGQRFETSQPYYGGKVDWNLTANHRLEATFLSDDVTVDVTNYDFDLDSHTLGPPGPTGTQERGGPNYIGKYTGILSPNFLLAAQYGRNDFNRTDTSQTDHCPLAVDSRGGGWDRLGCWVNDRRGGSYDGREAARLDVDSFVGSHSVRGGVDAEFNVSELAQRLSGRSILYLRGRVRAHRCLPLQESNVMHWERFGSFEANSRAAYLQDSWAVTPSVTLNLGLRYEEFENKNARGETFIEITGQWAPRLGIIWDPSGRGRSKLYGTYGLYYLPIPSVTNMRFGSGEYLDQAFFEWAGEYNPDGSPAGYTDCGKGMMEECGNQGSVGDVIPPSRILSDGTVSDPREILSDNFDPMSQWELIVGYEQMVGSSWSLGARFVARQFNEIIDDFAIAQALWEVYGHECYSPFYLYENVCGVEPFRLGNPGGDFEGWVDLDGTGELTPMQISAGDLGLPEPVRHYYAVELMFNRRFANNWMLQGSYTWAHLYGNYEGTVLSDFAQEVSGNTAAFDFPGLMENSSGNLAQDRRHNLKLFGSYAWDFGLQLGANAGFHTGRPINSFGMHPTDLYSQSYGPASFYTLGVPTPRGSSGTTDNVHWLDLMLKYDFRWGVDWSVRLDLFNVFNNQATVEVNEFAEQDSWPPDYVLDPTYGETKTHQSPRTIRIGVGFTF